MTGISEISATLDSTPRETHPADHLIDRVTTLAAPVCVGIDPVMERLPRSITAAGGGEPQAIGAFAIAVCDAVAAHVPCVKFQSACFERYGSRGVAALEQAMQHARELGLIVILDAKRGDIGISAQHYAAAAFEQPTCSADWATVSPYLGTDSIEPFLERGGVFALVRTSNPSGDAVQRVTLGTGETMAEHVARVMAQTGAAYVGASGYSALGAVVGATKADEIAALRAAMPQQVTTPL